MPDLRLETLGTIDLRQDTGARLVISQPKRLAVLAFLAVEAHGAYVRRDTLVGLFWPELDEMHARQNLRQTLYELRRALHPELFLARGSEEVGLSRSVFGCDATDFLDAVEAEAPGLALALYRGEFLPGFHLSDSRTFSGWLDETRARFAQVASDLASSMAEYEWGDGEVEAALAAGRRALALSPYDEGRLRRLMEMLAAAGRRASAVAEFRSFATRLADELGIEPSRETVAFVESISPPAAPAGPGSRQATGELHRGSRIPDPGRDLDDASRLRRWASPTIAAVGVTLVALALLTLLSGRSTDSRPATDPDRIVALPFDTDGAAPALHPYGEGLVHLLHHTMNGGAGSRIADPATTSDLWFAMAAGTAGARDSLAIEVATRLGASRLLEGALIGSREDLIVQARLRRVPDGRLVATASEDGTLDELPALVEAIAVKLLATDESPEPHNDLSDVPTPVLAEYVAGLQAFRGSRWATAFEHFYEALALDSSFTPPALQMLLAARRYGPRPLERSGEAERLAWALREQMSAADRAHMVALLGPRYPEARATGTELLEAASAAIELAPDRPQLYETLARWLLYFGPAAGIADWADRGAEALDRAIALTDRHLDRVITMRLVTARHESLPEAARKARVRELFTRIGVSEDRYRFFSYVAMGDPAALAAFAASDLSRPNAGAAWSIGNWTTYEGLETTTWARAVASLEAQALTDMERAAALFQRSLLAATMGRPSEAATIIPVAAASGYAEFGGLATFLTTPIHRALIEPGWNAAAAWADSAIADLSSVGDGEAPFSLYGRACRRGLAAVVRGESASARVHRDDVRGHSHPERVCADLIGALLEVRGGEDTLAGSLDRLDSAMRAVPLESTAWVVNAVLAQLWWERGDPQRALEAASRRGRAAGWALGTPAQMLVEARALAALGDVESAAESYRAYLRLRSRPDEWLRPRVDSARVELAALRQIG